MDSFRQKHITTNPGIVKKSRPKRKGRPRPLPPDVTARNLAIEKQRREALNENFLELARMLPNLASARRLTKVLIVNASLEHVRQQRALSLAAAQDMQEFLEENHRLTSEVNSLRAQVGGPEMPLAQAKPMTEAMVQLAETKNQVFGTFNAGFGDNWAYNAPQPQLGTSNDVYGIAPSVNNSYEVLDESPAINLPMEEIQTHIETLAPVPLPVPSHTEPQTNPGPYMSETVEPTSMYVYTPDTGRDIGFLVHRGGYE
ncbi:hypothetical protein FHETE_8450 [Fusarium heterosporum]|uniref:BHLH domain-containing protein n=1 Tax=Fusarium heterosporum TaxID=42747 RepID=A0A8H5T1X1_FUSHE|nr:hypothetical protein FHETE_8450 [Fusarium heterosporum]